MKVKIEKNTPVTAQYIYYIGLSLFIWINENTVAATAIEANGIIMYNNT